MSSKTVTLCFLGLAFSAERLESLTVPFFAGGLKKVSCLSLRGSEATAAIFQRRLLRLRLAMTA